MRTKIGGQLIMRNLTRFAMLLSLVAFQTSTARGQNVANCNASFTICFIGENVVLQLPFVAIAGDVIIPEPNSSVVSDVYRITNNLLDTGLGTGLGNQAVLFSRDNSMPLPPPSTYSANAATMKEAASGPTLYLGNGTTYTLDPEASPVLTKAFADAQIQLLGLDTTTLSFTLTNPAVNPTSLTNLSFTDTLPAGLIISTPNNLTGSCGGGSIVATAGLSSISLSGATLAPGASCTFSLNVSGIAIGLQTNTTSAVTSTQAPPAAPATASISVDFLFLYWFFAA
jgi:hypothetical protein